MGVKKLTETCTWCGEQLQSDYKGPCPKCGKVGKRILLELEDNISIEDALTWKSIREFYKKNPKIILLNILIIVYGSLASLVLNGLIGVLFSIIFGLCVFLVLPPTFTRIIQERFK